jgi:hypothetical protein
VNRNELILALISADYYRGGWTLNDRLYSPVSVEFVRDEAYPEWLRSLPRELVTTRHVGGGKTVSCARWVEEAWNCNNIARDFGGFLSRCMGVDVVRTGQARGNAAAGKFDFFLVPGDSASGHTINFFCDHDGRIHHFDAGSFELDHLSRAQLDTIFAGEST